MRQAYNVGNAYRASVGGFSPSDIGGLVAWFDFSDASSLWTDTAGTMAVAADGDAIAKVDDLSGSGYSCTQAVSGAQPTYKTGVQNGLPVGRFDGGDLLQSGSAFSITGSSSRTIVVAAIRETTANSQFVSWGAPAGAHDAYAVTQEYACRVSGGNKIWDIGSTTGVCNVSSWVQSGSTLADLDFFLNGTIRSATSSYGTGTTLATGSSVLFLGAWVPGSLYRLYGDLCELLIYDSGLSTSDRESIEDYLGQKWGVSIIH